MNANSVASVLANQDVYPVIKDYMLERNVGNVSSATSRFTAGKASDYLKKLKNLLQLQMNGEYRNVSALLQTRASL